MALTKISTGVIAANTLATANIADNSVDATKIASNSILTRHIDDDQITGDQLADNITIAGNLTITGNLTTNGSTVTNSSSNTTIEDAIIELGTGTSGAPATDAGIVIERGSSDNVFIGWDESADKVTVGTGSFTGASTGNLTITAAPFVSGALTASGISYPTSDGSAGHYLKTDGSGNLSFGAVTTQVDNYTATGNGSTTAFDTGINPQDEVNTWIFIDGVYQQKSQYSYSGSTVTFSTAPENGALIDVVTGTTGGMASSDTVLGIYEATTTNTAAYTTGISASNENNTWVFVGGVYQPKDSYTFSSGTLTFDANTPTGQKLSVVATKALTAGSVETSSLGANAVTSAKIASNAILSRHITNNSIVGADISATTQITANTFTGALTGNVTGNVAGNLTGTILTAAQTNITSVGTLSALTVSGQLTAGGIAYPTSDGNADQVLKTDGSGALSFGTVSGTTLNNNTNNYVMTGTGSSNTLNGEANLTFDGNNLKVIAAGNTTTGGNIQLGITTDDAAKYTAITAQQHDSGTETEGFTLIGGNSAANDTNFVNIGGGFGEQNPATSLRFFTGSAATREGTLRATIDSSGNVAIGTTTTFSNPLTLNKAAGAANSLNNQIALTHTGASTAYHIKTIRAAATDEPAGLAFVENTTERMRIDSSGNVGIGQASDGDKLHVLGTGYFEDARGNSVGVKIHGGSSSQFAHIGVTSSNPLTFQTADTERMRIQGNGRVGIGDTAPAGQLEVRNTSNMPTGIFVHEANNLGSYNDIMSSSTWTANSVNHQYFVCKSGNGSAISDIEFNLRGDGNAYADGSWSGGGADYAEYFEWADGNSSSQDRVGYSVSLVNNKIKIAESGETVIGVISGNPAVVGDNSWNSWKDKYQKDDYGRYIRNSDGHRISNPDYDDTLEYVKREDRKEWDIVGLMGKLRIKKGQQTGTNWIKMRDISASVEEWLVR